MSDNNALNMLNGKVDLIADMVKEANREAAKSRENFSKHISKITASHTTV